MGGNAAASINKGHEFNSQLKQTFRRIHSSQGRLMEEAKGEDLDDRPTWCWRIQHHVDVVDGAQRSVTGWAERAAAQATTIEETVPFCPFVP
jgi:hypothetical protein